MQNKRNRNYNEKHGWGGREHQGVTSQLTLWILSSLSPGKEDKTPGSKPKRHDLASTALPTCRLLQQSHFIHTGLTVVRTSQRFIIDQHQTFLPVSHRNCYSISQRTPFSSCLLSINCHWDTVTHSPCLLTAICPKWNLSWFSADTSTILLLRTPYSLH